MLPKPFCRLVVGGVVVVLQQIVDERIPFLLVHHALPTIHKLVSPGFGRTSDSLPIEGRAYTCRGGGGRGISTHLSGTSLSNFSRSTCVWVVSKCSYCERVHFTLSSRGSDRMVRGACLIAFCSGVGKCKFPTM